MSKNLIITEKPSVGRQIASVLGVKEAHDGYMENNDWVITWAVGHLITMSYPEKYDPELKKWRMDTLPFLPDEYKYEVIPASRDQFKVVKTQINRADIGVVYNAGDSGREGEYIQRLIYRAAGNKKPVKRIWIDSQTDDEIKRGIREAKPSSEYDNLSDAAYMRAIEDYAMGINFSRLLTLKFGNKLNEGIQPGEKKKKLSIGRVMTCVLGMVVNREREIKDFRETNFFKIEADCGPFKALWKIDKDSRFFNSPDIYNNSGFLRHEDAMRFIAELNSGDNAGVLTVADIERKKETKRAPLLYNLAELQAECSKRFKISPDKTLEIAQELYEAKLTTYPRTDARVLSTAVAGEINKNLEGLKKLGYHSDIADKILKNGSFKAIAKSKYTDDSKITDHYAIIPTGEGKADSLDGLNKQVYQLIVDRFLAIFLPAAEYGKTTITLIHANKEKFIAGEKKMLSPGYLELYGKEAIEESSKDEESDGNKIPKELEKGIKVRASFAPKESKTQPPKRYTSGTMVLAMENAGNLIEEEELREQIKGAGIGTSATRAGIIKKLDAINHIDINKKTQVITPTDDGEEVYDIVKEVLPDFLSPKMTASWEKGLSQIEDGTISKEKYNTVLNDYIKKKVQEIKDLNGGENFGKDLYEEQDMEEKCPHCGGDLSFNAYGVKCKNKCGMSFSYYGNILPVKAVQSLLQGKSIVIRQKSKDGREYNSRLIPKGIEENTYISKKTGEEKTGYRWEFEREYVDDKGKEYGSDFLGKCPKCGEKITNGRFGPECSGKCGMSFRYFGTAFTEAQVKSLLLKKSIVISQKSKKNNKSYKVKLTPKEIEPFTYNNKEGKEITGYQYTFDTEFVNTKKGKGK